MCIILCVVLAVMVFQALPVDIEFGPGLEYQFLGIGADSVIYLHTPFPHFALAVAFKESTL